MKKKNPVGRPPILLNNDQIVQIEALAAFLPIEKIADYLGISEKTFREIRDRDSTVSTAYCRGVARAHALAGGIVMKFMSYDADTPNIAQLQMQLDAAKFYLRTQAGWSEKQLVETKNTTPQLRTINIETREDDGRDKVHS